MRKHSEHERSERIEAALAAALHPDRAVSDEGAQELRICAGTSCHVSGRVALVEAFRQELQSRDLQDSVRIIETGCPGFCQQGPLMVVWPQGVFYPKLKPQSAAAIVEASVVNDGVEEKLLYKDPESGERIAKVADIPFYARQTRVVLDLNGRIDPYSIDDYLAHGGYAALAAVLKQDDPGAVIAEIEAAHLRGRGGGGYLTGLKWRQTRAYPGSHKYVICNGDEGDPGAFLDRSLMEGDPHLVLEGMIIAAFAIGAAEGYVYTRREYPFTVERLNVALEQARERGLLGGDILGSGFSFDLDLVQGMGSLVCGEATAIVSTLEGGRAIPRGKEIRLVEHGLWGQPTNVNNVETYANVPWVINHGAQAYLRLGHDHSGGTKIFSVSGKVRSSGLVEVPMGTSPAAIIEEVCGGMQAGYQVKAVQFGGSSGGALPAAALAAPADYDELKRRGLVMCSGGMVVIDSGSCMVEFARASMSFVAQESCGKCVPCRLGTRRLVETLDRIVDGRGRESDLELLEELSTYIIEGTVCALGGAAPTPLLTALEFYRDEFEAHIRDKACPAGQCKALISYYIDSEACTGCTLCAKKCPVGVISGEKKQPHVIDVSGCIKCDTCRQVCRFDAVKVRSGVRQVSGAAC